MILKVIIKYRISGELSRLKSKVRLHEFSGAGCYGFHPDSAWGKSPLKGVKTLSDAVEFLQLAFNHGSQALRPLRRIFNASEEYSTIIISPQNQQSDADAVITDD